MNIYIDFDGTLFDTNRFYNDFIILCEQYNIDKEDITKIRKESNELFNLDSLATKLLYKYHLNNSFIDKVNNLYNSSYLYNDSIKFLEDNYQKYSLFILTYGDYKYQQKKISNCNISKYFKNIIITKDKSKENIDYENSIFIDNNPADLKKLQLAGAKKLIRIKHKDDPYSKIDIQDVIEYFDLKDIDML